MIDQLSDAFNKNINNDNLSRETIIVTVENSTGGTLKMSVQIKLSLKNRIIGLNVVRAENLTNSAVYPTNAPFLSWGVSTNIMTILNITGIQDNNKYRLTLEIIS